MQATSLPKISNRPSGLRRPLTLIAALVGVLVLSNWSWADSCTTVSLGKQPITCTIPEQRPEVALNVTLTGLSFTSQQQGMVLIYDDSSHTMLSDVVTFTNVGGVATIAFVSDTDGVPAAAQGLPVLASFTESSKLITLTLPLANGQILHAKICSDWGSSTCYEGSDSITLSVGGTTIPEPGTFVLLGSGLLGTGAWRFAARSWGRRLLRRVNG